MKIQTFKIHKIENEVENYSINGSFIPLKFQYFTNNYCLTNSDKLKEFIELRVKVVSTQLTQNGKNILKINLEIKIFN